MNRIIAALAVTLAALVVGCADDYHSPVRGPVGDIEYRVVGDAATADVTISISRNEVVELSAVTVPWTSATYSMPATYSAAEISAASNDERSIRVEIRRDGVLWRASGMGTRVTTSH